MIKKSQQWDKVLLCFKSTHVLCPLNRLVKLFIPKVISLSMVSSQSKALIATRNDNILITANYKPSLWFLFCALKICTSFSGS